MGLITPEFGLFFWMLLAFGLVFVLLRKYAWGPIVRGLSKREDSIAEALMRAEAARAELAKLEQAREARQKAFLEEQHRSFQEAQAQREALIAEAKQQAQEEAARYIAEARAAMAQEAEQQRRQLKAEVLQLSLQVTERLLREELSTQEAQRRHMQRVVDEVVAHPLQESRSQA